MIIGNIYGDSRVKFVMPWHYESGSESDLGPSPKDLRQKPERNC
jgi:hypothetical protein